MFYIKKFFILFFLPICLFLLLQVGAGLATLRVRQSVVHKSILDGYNWFLGAVNKKTGRLEYLYFPQKDVYSKDNNDIRQLVAAWSIGKAQRFLKLNGLDFVVKNTLDYYLGKGAPTIAHAGLFILILLDFDYPQKNQLMQKSVERILSWQNPDGSYFIDSKSRLVDYTKKGIAPGEAMLGLISLYQKTKNPQYLESVKKAFRYYRNYWRKQPYFFVHWQTQAYYQLYKETKDLEVASFIFEMNDWISENLPRNNNTAVIMEGLNDAYNLALNIKDVKRSAKYKDAIKSATPFILSLQIGEADAQLFENPKKAKGGFVFSGKDSTQLIDFTFHSLNALIKIYENKLAD